MTDRELLELAAKAYGLQVKGWVGDCLSYFNQVTEYAGYGDWNPLDDDGDALRLAVKLSMDIWLEPGAPEVWVIHESAVEGLISEPVGKDPYAATRRAIVRAAAEIGKETA